MEIVEAKTKAQVREFGLLPYALYREDPVWVPPLRTEQLKLLRPETNPLLRHCDYALFLLKDGRETVGRLAAFVDHLAVDYWGKPIGARKGYQASTDLLIAADALWMCGSCNNPKGTVINKPTSYNLKTGDEIGTMDKIL